MYAEYEKAYRHYSAIYGADTAIFYLVGKFYEMYDYIDPATMDYRTSMRRAAELMNVQLSKKTDAPGGAGLFAGVPEQSLHKYAGILTNAGWTVAVFDQVKDAKGAVTERTVTRILSPGTHVEASISSASDNTAYFAGIWLEEGPWGSRAAPTFGLVSTDLTTGAVTTYESSAQGTADTWTADDAFHFFQVFNPRECAVWWRGGAVSMPTADFLKRQFGLHAAKLHIIHADARTQGGFEIPLVREDLLRRLIPMKTLNPFRQALGIDRYPKAERALCATLQRIEEMFPSGPKQMHRPEVWSPGANLFLGNHALIQLNMVTPRQEDSVLGLFMRTRTALGARAMRRRLLHPIGCAKRLTEAYEQIGFIGSMEPTGKKADLERALDQMADIKRLHRRITTGSIGHTDVLAIDQTYKCAHKVAALLAAGPLAAPKGLSLQFIQENFQTVFDIQKALKASDNSFCLQDNSAPTVAAIEKTIAEFYEKIQEVARLIATWASLPADSLRIEYRETLGPALSGPKAVMGQLAAALKGAKPQPYEGIQFNQKKQGSTVEIPILQTLYRNILEAREDLMACVKGVLPGLCDDLTEKCLYQWDLLEEWLALVDVTYTLWRVSNDLGFVRPLVHDRGQGAFIKIEGLRHPLIEASMDQRTEYVRHSVELGPETNGWLVYGMNASGKSSLMKAVGIAVLLAQAGCYVPAQQMTFAPFNALYTRILSTDNLWAGLSSFATEMMELQEILQRADDRTLVLGDEVCNGTESVSATALVAASLKKMVARQARFIFATHLHGLFDIPSVKALCRMKVWHLKVRYDAAADRLIYERTLTPGPGSSLYGLEVARAMNVPADVLEDAHAIRRELLGQKNASEAPMSDWNRSVQRRVCEMCGAAEVKTLEVHHIQPRKSATAEGRLADGTHQDHIRNLIVLCESCHDKHHAGRLEVAPLVQTSDGPLRLEPAPASVTASVPKTSGPRSKWTADQMETIQSYLKNYPNAPPKRLIFDLEDKEGIKISVASLKKIRETAGLPS